VASLFVYAQHYTWWTVVEVQAHVLTVGLSRHRHHVYRSRGASTALETCSVGLPVLYDSAFIWRKKKKKKKHIAFAP
jgi:hypothetical protein